MEGVPDVREVSEFLTLIPRVCRCSSVTAQLRVLPRVRLRTEGRDCLADCCLLAART
ncbi:unnamed protein product, partial [Trichogramma brassicae]